MSIQAFLTGILKNLRANDTAPSDEVVKKLDDDSLYLSGAAGVLKAIGATAEHGLTEETRSLFKQKIALVNAHQALVDKLQALDDAPALEAPSND